MTKIQMFQTAVVLEVANTILFWTLGNLIFEFFFGQFYKIRRYSDFEYCKITILNHAL